MKPKGQLTVLLMSGDKEVQVAKGLKVVFKAAMSLANLLASHVAVRVSLENVEGAIMKVKAVRASTVLEVLTLLMRVAETPKYKAS